MVFFCLDDFLLIEGLCFNIEKKEDEEKKTHAQTYREKKSIRSSVTYFHDVRIFFCSVCLEKKPMRDDN
jgi:hypothetical protein